MIRVFVSFVIIYDSQRNSDGKIMRLYFSICIIGLVRIVVNSNARKTSTSGRDIGKERTRPARHRASLAKHEKYFISEDELFGTEDLKYGYGIYEEPKLWIVENNIKSSKTGKWNSTDINNFTTTVKVKPDLRRKRSIGKSNRRQSMTNFERKLLKRSRKLNGRKAGRRKISGKRSSGDAGKGDYINMAFPSVDKELINNYLKNGYAVRIYNTITYDVIFRKNLPRLLRSLRRGVVRRKRSRRRSRGKRNRFDVSVRHRRHLSGRSETVGVRGRTAEILRHREKMRKCASNPCQNGGSCLRDKALKTEICLCAEGYYGFYCEGPVNRCSSLPCLNGGTCVSRDTRFECFCPTGFAGDKCETDVDECASKPCFHGGECHDLVNGYRCVCSQKYEGENCQYVREHNWLTICRSNTCLNGGICLKVTGDTRCVCPKLYSGNQCELPVADTTILCEKMLCLNGGICQALNRAGVKCLCPKLYVGKQCEFHTSPCVSSPCPDNKTCVEDRISFDRSFSCISGPDASIFHTKGEAATRNENFRKFGAARIAGITILLLIMVVAIFCLVCAFQEDEPRLQERKQLVSYSIPESNNTSNNISTWSRWKKAKEARKKRTSNL